MLLNMLIKIITFFLAITLIKTQQKPIIYLNHKDIRVLSYKGNDQYLFILLMVSYEDINNAVTVKINTEEDIAFSQIYSETFSDDLSGYSYQQLCNLDISSSTFTSVEKDFINSNNTFIYSISNEMVRYFDKYLAIKITINAKSKAYTYTSWVDHGLSTLEKVLITIFSLFGFIMLTTTLICCCCCPCCPIFLCLHRRISVAEQPLMPRQTNISNSGIDVSQQANDNLVQQEKPYDQNNNNNRQSMGHD